MLLNSMEDFELISLLGSQSLYFSVTQLIGVKF